MWIDRIEMGLDEEQRKILGRVPERGTTWKCGGVSYLVSRFMWCSYWAFLLSTYLNASDRSRFLGVKYFWGLGELLCNEGFGKRM